MCVYFRVTNLFTPVSNAEPTPIRTPSLTVGSLIFVVPGPMLTSLLTVLPCVGLDPLPPRMPHTGPQKTPLSTPHGMGTTPALTVGWALSRASLTLQAEL